MSALHLQRALDLRLGEPKLPENSAEQGSTNAHVHLVGVVTLGRSQTQFHSDNYFV